MGHADFFQLEIRRVDQTRDRRVIAGHVAALLFGLLVDLAGEIDAVQSLLDVQLARLAGGGVDAIEIEDAVSRIARRLHFGHENARAQRVDRAAGEVIAVAVLDGDGLGQLFD